MLAFNVLPSLGLMHINAVALPQNDAQSLEPAACPKHKDILEEMPDDAANL